MVYRSAEPLRFTSKIWADVTRKPDETKADGFIWLSLTSGTNAFQNAPA